MEEKITLLQAYKAMYEFLGDLYYREGQPDNLGGFLGGLQLLENGNTADPAAWTDWLDVVNRILKDGQE
jgi:hypothetical protein